MILENSQKNLKIRNSQKRRKNMQQNLSQKTLYKKKKFQKKIKKNKKKNFYKKFLEQRVWVGKKAWKHAECESDLKYYIIWREMCSWFHTLLIFAIFCTFLGVPRTPEFFGFFHPLTQKKFIFTT